MMLLFSAIMKFVNWQVSEFKSKNRSFSFRETVMLSSE